MFESEEMNNDILIQMHPSSDVTTTNAYAIVPAAACQSIGTTPIQFNSSNAVAVGSGDSIN